MSIRFVNKPLNIFLDEIDNYYHILIIESKTLLFKVIKDIKNQLNNEYGDFVLSLKDKPIELKNNLELILDPFELQINNRKILTQIQNLAISEAKNEVHYEETNKIICELEKYAQNLAYTFNGNIIPKDIISCETIIKSINFQIDTFCDNFYGSIFEYIQAITKYLGIQVFCFVNLFSYLENEEIKELMHSCKNSHLNIIFIESNDINIEIECCKKTIIDSDFCHI